MIGDLITLGGGDLLLAFLDLLIHELIHPPALHTHDVVVMVALVQLEYGMTAFEMMARHQPGGLELGQHPIHRRQADIVAGFQQCLVHVLRAHVTRVAALQNLEDLDPGQGHFEADVAKFLAFHGVCTSRYSRYSVIITHPPRNATRIDMRLLKSLALLLPLILIACAYRPDIKQGNFLTDAMIAKVKPGMTQTQVRFVLGPAMVEDPFHPNRWDYVYYNDPDSGPIVEKHVIVMFSDGKVVSVEQKPIAPEGPQGHG